MGLHQLQMALLVPDNSLLHFLQLKISFIEENKTPFFLDWCCHLLMRLCLMNPHYLVHMLSRRFWWSTSARSSEESVHCYKKIDGEIWKVLVIPKIENAPKFLMY